MNDKKIYDLIDIVIPYRNKLDMTENTTFGIEIEFLDKYLFDVSLAMFEYNLTNFEVTKDDSFSKEIGNEYFGGEIVSPVLTNDFESFKKIEDVLDVIQKIGGKCGEETGAHVHFGHQILSDIDSYKKFFLLWSAFEKIIMRFSYGKSSKPRGLLAKYSKPNANLYMSKMKKINEAPDLVTLFNILKGCTKRKREIINFENLKLYDILNGKSSYIGGKTNKSTIEIRCANGTFDKVIWQNNINVFYHFLNYCNSPSFDYGIINYILKNYDYNLDEIEESSKIYVEKAFLLADLIFTDELDKLYFLKQYFKAYDKETLKEELNIYRVKEV